MSETRGARAVDGPNVKIDGRVELSFEGKLSSWLYCFSADTLHV